MSPNDIDSNGHERWRTGVLYTVPEAARLAGVSPITVRRWLYGYQTTASQMPPVFGPSDRSKEVEAEVSFLQLAEIIVASRFRSRKVTLRRLRLAHEFARANWRLDYPFARMSLETDGVRVLRRFEESEPGASILALDQGGQWTLPGYVGETLSNFEFDEDLAARWFPVGKTRPIVVDPRFSVGLPTIPARRVTVRTVHRRWIAGYDIDFISEDLRLDRGDVEEVLRFAERVAA